MKNIIGAVFVLAMAAAIPFAKVGEAQSSTASDAMERECSECHMAFPPQFLPKRSWIKIMATLDNHFGEDASLGPARVSEVEAYLVANAADVSLTREGRKMLRNVSLDQTPLRITELPRFRREHRESKIARYRKRYDVKTLVDCKACHRDAEQGYYDDD